MRTRAAAAAVPRSYSHQLTSSFRNTYPVLAAADNKMLRFVIIAVVALHAAMALAMKVLFFS